MLAPKQTFSCKTRYLTRAPKRTRIFEMFVWIVDGMGVCGLFWCFCMFLYLFLMCESCVLTGVCVMVLMFLWHWLVCGWKIRCCGICQRGWLSWEYVCESLGMVGHASVSYNCWRWAWKWNLMPILLWIVEYGWKWTWELKWFGMGMALGLDHDTFVSDKDKYSHATFGAFCCPNVGASSCPYQWLFQLPMRWRLFIHIRDCQPVWSKSVVLIELRLNCGGDLTGFGSVWLVRTAAKAQRVRASIFMTLRVNRM